jgi:hypothetical protein
MGQNAMLKESSPLWVWLTVGLIVVGSIVYVTSVFFMEYIVAVFQ